MYKNIISLFFFICFFTGCEDKNVYGGIIKKLKEQNTTVGTKVKNVEKENLKNENEKVVVSTPKEIKKTFVNKEETRLEKNITDLALKTISGDTIKLHFKDDGIVFDKYRNKIIILDVFTTWCPPCLESIAHLNQLQKQYKKDLQIIGILMEEDKRNSEVLAFKRKYNIKYFITNSKENFKLVDTWGGVSGYPTIIIFDKNGTYFNHFNGSPPLEMLESDIKKALRK
jgi:thiol-disulfide isomerase/thioredoxin